MYLHRKLQLNRFRAQDIYPEGKRLLTCRTTMFKANVQGSVLGPQGPFPLNRSYFHFKHCFLAYLRNSSRSGKYFQQVIHLILTLFVTYLRILLSSQPPIILKKHEVQKKGVVLLPMNNYNTRNLLVHICLCGLGGLGKGLRYLIS